MTSSPWILTFRSSGKTSMAYLTLRTRGWSILSDYSYRNATMGSTRMARRAGM